MPPLSFTRQSRHYFTQMLNKYARGVFERQDLRGKIDNFNQGFLELKAIRNCSDRLIKFGDRCYVIGCDMPQYPYEEALYFAENYKICLNIRLINAGESNDDCITIFGKPLEPWACYIHESTMIFPGERLGFYPLKLSDDYNGTDDFYYAKEYEPIDGEDEEENSIYTPYYITTKKEDGATWRVLDGSNLPWSYLYPEWYKSRSKKYPNVSSIPRVVLALMKKLSDPIVPRGRYVATVVEDKVIADNDHTVKVKFSVTLGGKVREQTVAAWSPLSSANDKFRKDQKVLIGLFNETDDYVIINAEC